MEPNKHEYGKPNPNAPRKLSQFAFLIGMWRGEAKLKGEDGAWESLSALWEGRYILDGYAIADEYRMMTPAGKILVLGMNFRSYDTRKKAWNLKWLDALNTRSREQRTRISPQITSLGEARGPMTARHGSNLWSSNSIAARDNRIG